MSIQRDWLQLMSRRQMFGRTAWGIGTCALASLLNRPAAAGETQASEGTHFPARAKRVIYISRAGGPAQMEMYDYKPRLTELHGKPVPKSVIGDQRLTLFSAIEKELSIVASPYRFAQHSRAAHGSANCCRTWRRSPMTCVSSSRCKLTRSIMTRG